MRLKDTLSLIKNKYRNNGIGIVSINIDALSTKDLYQGNIPHKKCYAERTEVTVDPGGNLIPCPFISNYNYGSLLDSAFDNVWNNDKHKKFRKFQNRGKLQMCDHCILGVQRNPTFFTSLKPSTAPLSRDSCRPFIRKSNSSIVSIDQPSFNL